MMDYPRQHFPKSLYSMSQAGQRSRYSSPGLSNLEMLTLTLGYVPEEGRSLQSFDMSHIKSPKTADT